MEEDWWRWLFKIITTVLTSRKQTAKEAERRSHLTVPTHLFLCHRWLWLTKYRKASQAPQLHCSWCGGQHKCRHQVQTELGENRWCSCKISQNFQAWRCCRGCSQRRKSYQSAHQNIGHPSTHLAADWMGCCCPDRSIARGQVLSLHPHLLHLHRIHRRKRKHMRRREEQCCWQDRRGRNPKRRGDNCCCIQSLQWGYYYWCTQLYRPFLWWLLRWVLLCCRLSLLQSVDALRKTAKRES